MIAPPTLANYFVTEARITMPSQGAWRIDATVDARGVEISGQQSFVFGDTTLTGHVDEFTEYAGVGIVVLSPGAGATQKTLSPAAWRNASVRTIAIATLKSVGENLSSGSDSLSTVWPYYTRMKCNFGAALSKISSLAGCVWRYADDGSVLIVKENFLPTANPYRVLTRDPRIGQITIVSEQLFARPGQNIDGKNIVSVEHHIEEAKIRSVLTYEVSP